MKYYVKLFFFSYCIDPRRNILFYKRTVVHIEVWISTQINRAQLPRSTVTSSVYSRLRPCLFDLGGSCRAQIIPAGSSPKVVGFLAIGVRPHPQTIRSNPVEFYRILSDSNHILTGNPPQDCLYWEFIIFLIAFWSHFY